MSVRRLSVAQVLKLVEGAELIAGATGLSISEIIDLVLSEPPEEGRGRDEREEEPEEIALRAGGR